MHLHTPDLSFTLAFAVLVVAALVVSIAVFYFRVVRLRHANCWANFRHTSVLVCNVVNLLTLCSHLCNLPKLSKCEKVWDWHKESWDKCGKCEIYTCYIMCKKIQPKYLSKKIRFLYRFFWNVQLSCNPQYNVRIVLIMTWAFRWYPIRRGPLRLRELIIYMLQS